MASAALAAEPDASVGTRHHESAGFVGLGLHQRYAHAHGVVETEIDGRRILFSTRTGRMYRLNETAARTWMTLRVVTAASAAAMLAAEFDVRLVHARADVMALIEALCDEGLLVPAG